MSEKFENTTISGHFVFAFDENSSRGISFISGEYHFFLKMFPSTLKHKAGVFKFLLFEERYRKAPFS